MTSAGPSERSGFFVRLSAAGNRFLAAVSGDLLEAKAYARRAENGDPNLFPVPKDLQGVFHLKRMQDQTERAAFLKKTANYEAAVRRDEGCALSESAREKPLRLDSVPDRIGAGKLANRESEYAGASGSGKSGANPETRSFDGLMLIRLSKDTGLPGGAAPPPSAEDSRAADSRTADSRTADSRAADSRAADSRTADTSAGAASGALASAGAAGNISCDFFNKDGSFADLCGNAACCAVFFGKEIGVFDGPCFSFSFADSFLKGDFDKNRNIWLSVPRPAAAQRRRFVFQEKEYEYDFVRAGVPHGVLNFDAPLNPSRLNRLLPLAKALRENGNGEEGMNVTFFHYEKERADPRSKDSGARKKNRASFNAEQQDGKIKESALRQNLSRGGGEGRSGENKQRQEISIAAATYERGVEDWTGACGTGALAAALSFEKARTVKAAALQASKSKTKAAGSQEACKGPAHWTEILTVNMPGGALKVRLPPCLQLSSPAQYGWER